MKHLILALMLFLIATTAFAQTRIKVQNLSEDISRSDDLRKELRSYQLFNLQIDQVNALSTDQNSAPSLFLELDDQQPLELVLEPSNIKTKDYQVTIHTAEGYRQAEENPVYNYQGYLRSNTSSKVSLTVAGNQFSGVIQNYQGDNLHFKTLLDQRGQYMVIYKDSDLLQPTSHTCGSPDKSKTFDGTRNRVSQTAASCVVTEIYLIADAAAVDAFGGSPASTEANMLEVLNLVNSHYEVVGVKFEVSGIFISTDPNGPWPIRNNADDQLDAAISWFNAQNFPGDVFTFWSSPDWDYSYAYVGAICSSFGGNLCAAWGGLTANTLNSNTQAHELGHNFDAGHDASGIMRSTVSNQPSSFSANSISVMTNYIPSVEDICLDECVDDCSNFVADAGTDQSICPGSSTSLQATGGASYIWTPTTGLDNPNVANPIASPTTTTTYTVSVSNNSGCSGQAQMTVTVLALPEANAGPDQVLSCNTASVTLDGSGSSTGGEFTYSWTTNDGNILAGASTIGPTVDASGTYTLTVTNESTGCQASDEVAVTNDASLPGANSGPDQMLTCVVASVNLDGSSSSQGANISYEWTTNDGNIVSGVDTDQATADAPGTYTLTVTETASGCTSFDQVVVTQDVQLPVADAGQDLILGCGSTSLNVGGPNSSAGNEFSYQWSTNDGNISGSTQNATAEVTSAGTYDLLVSNSITGCSQADQVVVTEDISLPVATAGGDQILNCQATQMTLNGTGSSTGSNFSYLWTTTNGNIISGEQSLMAVIDQPGDYTLTVSNELNSCLNSDQVNVTLSATLPIANGGADQLLSCAINTVTLDGSGSSAGANFSYQWTTNDGNIVTGAGTQAPVVDSDGIYLLTVTDSGSGCESTDEVLVTNNVEVPRADAGRDVTIGCSSNTIDLRGDNSSAGPENTYLWTTLDGNMVSGQNTPILTVDAGGTYTLTVTNTNTGCSSSDDALVLLDNTLPIADAGGDEVINCQNPQVQLDGSNSDQGDEIRYRWTTSNGNIVSGSSNEIATVDIAGSYILTVTNTNSGCSQTDEVEVTGNTNPPTADAGSNQIINCQNPTAVLGGTEGQSSGATNLSYQWTTANGNIVSETNVSQISVDQAGLYLLTVTNTLNNCTTQDQVTVSGSSTPPMVEAGDEIVVPLGESTQLNASSNDNVTYQWSPAGVVDNPNIANPMATPDQTVTLTVTVTDGNNCVFQDQITLIVPVAEDLQIPNSFSPNGDGVNDTWNVPGLEYLGSYTLEVFNRTGNSVHRGLANWDGTYQGDVLPTGTYYYIFNFADQGSLAGHVNIIK